MPLRKITLLAASIGVLFFITLDSHAFLLTRPKVPVLSATDTDALKAHIGQKVSVEGVILSTARPASDKLRFLNFSTSRNSGFTAALVPAVYKKFPDLDNMTGQRARVTGELKAYKQKTVIKVSRASQVKIFKQPKSARSSKPTKKASPKNTEAN